MRTFQLSICTTFAAISTFLKLFGTPAHVHACCWSPMSLCVHQTVCQQQEDPIMWGHPDCHVNEIDNGRKRRMASGRAHLWSLFILNMDRGKTIRVRTASQFGKVPGPLTFTISRLCIKVANLSHRQWLLQALNRRRVVLRKPYVYLHLDSRQWSEVPWYEKLGGASTIRSSMGSSFALRRWQRTYYASKHQKPCPRWHCKEARMTYTAANWRYNYDHIHQWHVRNRVTQDSHNVHILQSLKGARWKWNQHGRVPDLGPSSESTWPSRVKQRNAMKVQTVNSDMVMRQRRCAPSVIFEDIMGIILQDRRSCCERQMMTFESLSRRRRNDMTFRVICRDIAEISTLSHPTINGHWCVCKLHSIARSRH